MLAIQPVVAVGKVSPFLSQAAGICPGPGRESTVPPLGAGVAAAGDQCAPPSDVRYSQTESCPMAPSSPPSSRKPCCGSAKLTWLTVDSARSGAEWVQLRPPSVVTKSIVVFTAVSLSCVASVTAR